MGEKKQKQKKNKLKKNQAIKIYLFVWSIFFHAKIKAKKEIIKINIMCKIKYKTWITG